MDYTRSFSSVYGRLSEKYKASGLKVRVWTVNREKDMKKFIEEDLEAVITNYPDTALTVRRQVENAADNGFIKDKRLFLLDIDGTVCIGQRLIDGTREFLKAVKNSGGQFVFITNNSTRSIEDYILSFQKLGVMTDYTNFVTASFATVQYLKKHYDGKLIYVMGTKSLIRELKKNKIRVTTDCMDGILPVSWFPMTTS